jgi:hypothetical protein
MCAEAVPSTLAPNGGLARDGRPDAIRAGARHGRRDADAWAAHGWEGLCPLRMTQGGAAADRRSHPDHIR